MSSPDRVSVLRQHGVTLVELIIFIVVVSASVVGVLSVMNVSTQRSADPMIRKQALDIAESLMEEVFLQSFTYCDPDDEKVSDAANAGECLVAEAMGPEVGESRYSATTPFDNVNDYAGFVMNGIVDLTGTAIPALAGYNAVVAIAEAGTDYGLAAPEALRITVTVTSGNVSIPVTAVRFRHSPNFAP
ncbi:type II secretion system protein [Noviherbaspirillum sp. ST9]|uniref:type II secretion system protein n=1 Tax=Noviherbaspirillum sp. ST9 TaxID=3401606 RepID=UPI003B58AC24